MASFLFWNVRGKELLDEIATASLENEVDVLILAEYPFNPVSASLLEKLNVGPRVYTCPFDPSPKLTFVSRYPVGSLTPIYDEGGISIRQVTPPLGLEVLLVALHMPSKLYMSKEEQAINSVRLAEAIAAAETKVGHANSVVIGDLNMDPYEDGMVSADGLHGVMDKSIALELSRTVGGKVRSFFYNPMWSRLGDETTHGPPGTYFRRGGQISPFWHTFDQVLLRPSLLEYYSPSALRVITRIGDRDLLRAGRIDASVSDHLPVLLRLEVQRSVQQ
jgi:hypothetical protein